MSTTDVVVHFPVMHPELWLGAPAAGGVFLDPGLGPEGSDRLRPANLPLDGKAAAKALGDALSMGDHIKRPADLALHLAPQEDRSRERAESTRQLTREIMRRAEGGAPAAEAVAPPPEGEQVLVRAQMALLLAWGAEEDRIEQQQLRRRLSEGFQGLDLGLSGPEGEGDGEDGLERSVIDTGKAVSNLALFDDEEPLDWETVLSAMLPFLPEGAVLAVQDATIVRDLADRGFEQIDARRVRGRGSLAPKARSFPGPWLDRTVEIVLADEVEAQAT